MKHYFDFFFRKKNFEEVKIETSKLKRALNVFDLTALGTGCTIVAIYMLIGIVVSRIAGPASIISFALASCITSLSALSYAELSARVPRSGSAYAYIYVTIGEFFGFVIGWDMLLEYMIGTASVATSLSQYIDSLCDNKISKYLKAHLAMNVRNIAPYPDFLAFALTMVVVVFLMFGVKDSANFNKILTSSNILLLVFIIVAGSTKTDVKNWNLNVTQLNENRTCENCGQGGFFPFGINGVITATAKCFFAYIGFDAVSTTGEEVHNPTRSIPLSILLTLVIVTVTYLGVTIVLTLMMPYYLMDASAPVAMAFMHVDYDWAKYVVSVGAIISLFNSLYSGLYPPARIAYSMANDGLLYKCFSIVLPKLHTPVLATFTVGLITAILSAIFDLNELVEMTSIGTLMAYILVCASVIVLRYRPTGLNNFIEQNPNGNLLRVLFKPTTRECNLRSSAIVNTSTFLIILLSISICLLLSFVSDLSSWYMILMYAIHTVSFLLLNLIIWRQPQNDDIKTFKLPLMPLIPNLSILLNIYLIMSLSGNTWIRFSIWFAIGFAIYFGYGIRNSRIRNDYKNYLTFF